MDSQPHLFQDIPPPYSDGVGLTWHPARGIVVTERREISAYLKKIHQTVVTQYIKHPYMVPGHSFHDSRQFSFRHSACLNEFPRGYVLLAVSRAEGKGVDKYISGHPSLSQYRSMKEFEPHIVWLTSDCTSMYKNCACVLCKKMPPTSQAMLVDINGQVRKLSPQVQSVPVPPSKSAPKQELQQQPFNPRNATKSEMVREVQASFVPKISSTAGTGPGKLLGNHQTSASASSQYPPYHQNATLRNLQPAKASSVGRSSQQTQKRDTPVNDTTQPGSECVVQSGNAKDGRHLVEDLITNISNTAASASTSALPQKGTDSKWSSNVINHSHSHLHTKHSTAPKKEKHHSTAANKSLLGAVKELQVEGLLGYDSKKLYSANAKPAVKKEKQSRNQASATGNYLPSPESGRQKRLPSCEEPVLTCQPATGGATLPMKVKKPSQFLANESASGRKNFGTFRREGFLASNLEFLGETTNGPDIASNSTQKLPVLTTDVAKVEKSLISPLSEGSEPGGNSGRQIVSGGHEMLEIEETPTSDDGMLTKAEVIPPTKEIRAFACEQTPCLEHLNQSSPSSDEETTPGIFVDLSRKHVKNLSDRAKMIKERKRRNRQLQEDSLSNLSNGAGACTFTQNQGGSVDSKRRRVESSISGGNSMEDILEDILEVRIPPAAAFMENTISSLNVWYQDVAPVTQKGFDAEREERKLLNEKSACPAVPHPSPFLQNISGQKFCQDQKPATSTPEHVPDVKEEWRGPSQSAQTKFVPTGNPANPAKLEWSNFLGQPVKSEEVVKAKISNLVVPLPTPLHRDGELVWIMATVADITAFQDVYSSGFTIQMRISQECGWVPWPCVVRETLVGFQFGRPIVTSGHVEIYSPGIYDNCSSIPDQPLEGVQISTIEEDLDAIVIESTKNGKRSKVYPVAYVCELLGLPESCNRRVALPEFHVRPFTDCAFPEFLCPPLEDLRQMLMKASLSVPNMASGHCGQQSWRSPAFVAYARALAGARRHVAANVKVCGSHSQLQTELTENFGGKVRKFIVTNWSYKALHWGAETIHLGDVVRIQSSEVHNACGFENMCSLDDASGVLPEGQGLMEVIAIEWDPVRPTGPGSEPQLFIVGRPCTLVDIDFYPEFWSPLWTKVLRKSTGKATLYGAKVLPFAPAADSDSAGKESGLEQPALLRVPAEQLIGRFHGMQWAASVQRAFLPPLPGELFSGIAPTTNVFDVEMDEDGGSTRGLSDFVIRSALSGKLDETHVVDAVHDLEGVLAATMV